MLACAESRGQPASCRCAFLLCFYEGTMPNSMGAARFQPAMGAETMLIFALIMPCRTPPHQTPCRAPLHQQVPLVELRQRSLSGTCRGLLLSNREALSHSLRYDTRLSYARPTSTRFFIGCSPHTCSDDIDLCRSVYGGGWIWSRDSVTTY
jgi:hypothetical protein